MPILRWPRGPLTGKYAAGGGGRLTQDPRYAARYALPGAAGAAAGLARLAADALGASGDAGGGLGDGPSGKAGAPSAPAMRAAGALAGRAYIPDGAGVICGHRGAALYPAPPTATDRTEETT